MTDFFWNPDDYGSQAKESMRLQPAIRLLRSVHLDRADLAYDLGSGAGASSGLLRESWPDARVVGVDYSPLMLERARRDFADVTFVEADIRDWQPDEQPDLIYSSGTLHWVPDHWSLVPRLFRSLKPGGWLAIQQPNNFDGLTHTLLQEIAGEPQFRAELRGKIVGANVLDARDYHNLLRPSAARVDVWETEYLQALTGDDPVLDWMVSTACVPIRNALDSERYAQFEGIYRKALLEAYPRADDGVTLLPFRRMYIVASRPD